MRGELVRCVRRFVPPLGVLIGALAAAAPAAADPDPFAAPAGASPSPAGGVPAAGSALDTTCGHITSALCSKQNTTMLLIAAGYVVLCVAGAALWRASWARRGHGSAAAQFLAPGVAGAAASGLLIWFDPARGDDLRCCLASAVFRGEIFFQESVAARAVVLGVLPAALLYTLVVFAVGAMRR